VVVGAELELATGEVSFLEPLATG